MPKTSRRLSSCHPLLRGDTSAWNKTSEQKVFTFQCSSEDVKMDDTNECILLTAMLPAFYEVIYTMCFSSLFRQQVMLSPHLHTATLVKQQL